MVGVGRLETAPRFAKNRGLRRDEAAGDAGRRVHVRRGAGGRSWFGGMGAPTRGGRADGLPAPVMTTSGRPPKPSVRARRPPEAPPKRKARSELLASCSRLVVTFDV